MAFALEYQECSDDNKILAVLVRGGLFGQSEKVLKVKAVDLMGTMFQIQLQCSRSMANKIVTYRGGDHAQVTCFMALFFLKHYAPESNWDSLENQASWDAAVNKIMEDHPLGFNVIKVDCMS